MASTDIYMRILMSATSGNVLSTVNSVVSSLGKNGLLGAIIGVTVAVGAMVVGFVAASIKMAGDFQSAMNRVQALTGSSTQQMAYYNAQLMTLATNAGVAPSKLADGLYNVISAGYQGADAIRLLTLATQDSKIGMTDAATTTKSLTALLAQFNISASDATRVNGEMLETVTLGSGTFEQYAQNIVKSASAASQFGVSLETMNAAYATLTSSQISAGQASTDFQQSLKVMYGNINTVVKSLDKNGIAFDENAFNAANYGDKVKMLDVALDEAHAKHVSITGVTLQAAQAIHTIATHMDVYNKNLKTLSDNAAMAKKTQDAWATTQSGFNQQMDRLNAASQVLMITIGTKLLPYVTTLVGWITPLVTGITQWATQSNGLNGVLDTLGKVGQIIAAQMMPELNQAWQSLTASLKPVMPELQQFAQFIGVILVVAIIIFARVFAGLVQVVSGTIQIISGYIAFFVDLFTGKWSKLGQDLQVINNGMMEQIRGFFTALTINAEGWGKNIIQGIINGIQSMLGNLGNMAGQAAQTIANFFPHSPAKYGVLRDLPVMGMQITQQLSKGMVDGIPKMQQAANQVASPLATSLSGGGSTTISQGGNRSVVIGGHTFNISVSTMTRSQVEVSRLVDMIEQEIGNRFRGQTPGYNAGNIF